MMNLLQPARSLVRRTLGRDRAAEQRRRVEATVCAWTDHRVANGPFCGMRYVERALGSMLAPKLLGTYERELHGWLARIAARRYRVVHDIGCAEGYYAVGLCLLDPGVRVRAYDLDPGAPALLSRLATLNGVGERVVFCGGFGPASLSEGDDRPMLVFCDIEGAERDVLDPDRIPALRHGDVLVELHDGPTSTQIYNTLLERFRRTHAVETVSFAGRSANDVAPAIRAALDEADLHIAMDERRRLGLRWCFMTTREGADDRSA